MEDFGLGTTPEPEVPADFNGMDGGGSGNAEFLGEYSDVEQKPKEVPMRDEIPDKYVIEGESDEYNASISKSAKELGVSNERLQKIKNVLDAADDEEHAQIVGHWIEDIHNMPNFEQEAGIAKAVLDKYAPDREFLNILAETGIGNHPALFKALSAIGHDLGINAPKRKSMFPNSRME